MWMNAISSSPSVTAVTDREAYIVLNMISGIGPARLAALLEFSPDPAGIFSLPEQELLRIPGISAPLAKKILNWEKEIDLTKEIQMIERGGVDLLIPTDDAYPANLKEIHNAPICLYVRGKIPADITQHGIAMVGTRNISHYGSEQARRLAEAASYAGWIVVSGLAVGTDTIVHRATVNAGGKTVAVLGGGLARLHPQENLQLARDIISTGGAIITEFPMTFSPSRHTFPMRNRIISGLTQGTIVVEAGINSGSLITAAHAIEQGRRVFAVPGNVDSGSTSGCNSLIRKGAILIENFEHVLEEFDFLPGFDSVQPMLLREEQDEDIAYEPNDSANISSQAFPAEEQLQLGPAADAIMDALKKGDLSIESLTVQTGFPAHELLSAAIALEIMSRVKRNPDGSLRRLR